MDFRWLMDGARRLRIKWMHWEYWPMWLVYASVSFYYIWLSLRSKSLFFFSASNPSIDFGGMCFERKSAIYDLLPEQYCPKTMLVFPDVSKETLSLQLAEKGIGFPCIAKPDIGGKGWGVKKIYNWHDLYFYQSVCRVEFLLQELVSEPEEYSVFYCRYPSSESGFITSVTHKKLLTVTGDGMHTIDYLIRKDDRAFLQWKVLKKQGTIEMNRIPSKGELVMLVPYGNHARGALFIDQTHWVDEAFTASIDRLAKQIDGFYFGRFDLLTSSFEDLKSGRNIKIVELNGCGAEPIHIYQPGFSFFKGQKIIWQHFKWMREIAAENHKSGVKYLSCKGFIKGWKNERQYKSKAPESLLNATPR